MIDYQTISIVLTGIGMIIALTYYALQIRNQNKTRRMQFLTQMSNSIRTVEGYENYFEVMNAEWSSYDDFERKYGSDNNPKNAAMRYSMWNTHNDLGYLVRIGLIDIEDVYHLMETGTTWLWMKWEPIISYQRKRYNGADWLSHFEYLATELLKIKISRDPTYTVPENFTKYNSEHEPANP